MSLPTAETDQTPLDELKAMVQCATLEDARARLSSVASARVPHLVEVARAHGLEAWLAACAPDRTGVWHDLAVQRQAFLAAHMRQVSTVRQLGSMLDAGGHAWVVLKGASLADTCYPRPDLRSAIDIDLLVSPQEFEHIVDTMLAADYRLVDLNWPVIRDRMPGELRFLSPNNSLIDLHWHLLNDPRVRARFRLPTTPLLQRRRVSSGGPPTLEDSDQLVHVALHATLSGGNRLMWLVDLDRFVRARTPDWDQVVERAAAARCGPAVALALSRARAQFDTPIPERVLTELAGGRAMRVTQDLVNGLRPLGSDPSNPGIARAFARSARSGWWASQREFGRHAVGWIRTKVTGSASVKPWLDPLQETSALYPVPDPDARAAYFEALKAND